MGEMDRFAEYKRKKISFGDDGNALVMLVAINGIIFIGLTILKILFWAVESTPDLYRHYITNWFIMPADYSNLLYRPWTIFSFSFTHTSVIMLISNMLWLWVFGSIFQLIAGNKKLIPLYIFGGVAGAIGFIAAIYLIPNLRPSAAFAELEGANAAILAVAVATTALTPEYRFFRMLNGGIPIWVLTLVYLVIDFAGITSSGAAYHISHLSGAFIGYMFVVSLKRGRDWSVGLNRFYDWITNVFNPHKGKAPVIKMREKVFYEIGKQKPFTKTPNISQDRIDQILDKINQKGYNALTTEEQAILKKASESDFL
ncbi:MAG: rhomboid family intramembrane serine protease [Ginsengibacter sp.]